MIATNILNRLNEGKAEDRLRALEDVMKTAALPPVAGRYINNHIHTKYSFSPYSPAAAVFAARSEGLSTAGIIDHDTIGGAREFLAAGDIVKMPTTIGFECRVSMKGTAFADVRTNNPDQKGVSYVTVQAVPHDMIDRVQRYFAPLRERRNDRNRKMTAKINSLLGGKGITLDFDKDVLPLSLYDKGGVVTERHLMLALAMCMMKCSGRGSGLIAMLGDVGVELSEKQKAMLLDTSYEFYEYDVLGILKGAFVPQIYVDATEECPLIDDVIKLAGDIGAIFCYAYLGDVGDSVTGDKKAQKFEDDYLDDLIAALVDKGVGAVTYMPARNTRDQLLRLRDLCERYGLFQVSGEDINSPRQSFICRAMDDPMFSNLIDSTWALIAHERGEKKIILRKDV